MPLIPGFAFAILLLAVLSSTRDQFLTFVVFAALTLITLLVARDAPGDRENTFGRALLFVFAAGLLLPPLAFVALVLLVPLSSSLRPYLGRRGDWGEYCPGAGETLRRILSGLLAGGFYRVVPHDPTILWLAALAGAALQFFLADSLLALIFLLARRRADYWRFFLARNWLPDAILLFLGAAITALWVISPLLIVPALLQLLLVKSVAQIPRLKRQAQMDEKTGLWNARHLDTLFAAEIRRAQRFARPLGIIMADMDLLRQVNNSHGHLAGDAVLRQVGQLIRHLLREYDVAARFGGEEFVIVLPETDENEAGVIAERLRLAIAVHDFNIPTRPDPIHATMSFGVASYPADGPNAEEVLHAADVAVYAAKAQGRNRTVLAAELPNPAGLAGQSRERAVEVRAEVLPVFPEAVQHVVALLRRTFSGQLRLGAAGALAALLLTCGLLGGTLSVIAVQHSLPGDGLYVFKSAIETMEERLATRPADLVQLRLDRTHRRLQELSDLIQQGRYEGIGAAVNAYVISIRQTEQALDEIYALDPLLALHLAEQAEREWSESQATLAALVASSSPGVSASVVLALDVSRSAMSRMNTFIASNGTSSINPAALGLPFRPTPYGSPSGIFAPFDISRLLSLADGSVTAGDSPIITAASPGPEPEGSATGTLAPAGEDSTGGQADHVNQIAEREPADGMQRMRPEPADGRLDGRLSWGSAEVEETSLLISNTRGNRATYFRTDDEKTRALTSDTRGRGASNVDSEDKPKKEPPGLNKPHKNTKSRHSS